YFYRYMKAMKDYFAGGNRIPWWLSGVSYYMSSFSAFAFIAYSGLAYKYGLGGVTFYWISVPAAAFGVIFFARRWRRARVTSPVEYLESRYSSVIRQLFAWQGVPVKLIDDALKLVAIGTFLVILLGSGGETEEEMSSALRTSMLWAGLIMLSYTFMGGLWAVTVTDFLQFVIMMAAVLILVPLAIKAALDATGGLDVMIERAPPGFFNLLSDEYSWVYIAVTVVLYCLSYSVNWGLVQRYYCVPNEREARKVGWLVVALNVVTPPLMFMPAMLGYYFLPELTNSNEAYPRLCMLLLPTGLLGLVVAAMFSATMSMLSTDFNVCASVMTNDVYRRLLRPNASQKELVLVGRLMTLLAGVLVIGVAFWMTAAQTHGGDALFRSMVTLFSVAVPPVAIPMLWGLISRRVNSTSALAAFFVGVAVGLAMFTRWPAGLFGELPDEGVLWGAKWKLENLIFCTTALVTLITIAAASGLVPTNPAERRRAEAFIKRLRVPIGGLQEDFHTAEGVQTISPFRVVGICMLIIGLLLLVILPWVSGLLAIKLNLGMVAVMVIGGIAMVWWSARSRPAAGDAVARSSRRSTT
ncbi:MAG: hypothetical protein GXY44_12675, partial [Phycisphaerales bacterium]|nr:hypothetical protein [Phycisphaerales bacterium]